MIHGIHGLLYFLENIKAVEVYIFFCLWNNHAFKVTFVPAFFSVTFVSFFCYLFFFFFKSRNLGTDLLPLTGVRVGAVLGSAVFPCGVGGPFSTSVPVYLGTGVLCLCF